jgi:RNA-directed DNA polymerase
MTNALERSLSNRALREIWKYEKRRLTRSAYGVDRISGRKFDERLSYEIYRLRERAFGKFQPNGLLAISKPKPSGGVRIICVPTIADRLLQFALLTELRPKLAQRGLLNSVSYGLMRNARRGVVDARTRAVKLRTANPWVYKADIQRFFDRIPRAEMKAVASRIIDQRTLHRVVLPYIDAEITDGFDPDWSEIIRKAGIVTGQGIRQGMPLSPYFAGMLMRDLDQKLERQALPVIRYVDDIVAFFSTRDACLQFHAFLKDILAKLGLTIGDPGTAGSKTAIYEPAQSADFLGMQIAPTSQGGYCLRVSKACIEKVGAKFCHAVCIDELLRKRLTLTRLGAHLDSMQHGYAQAYQGAENHGELIHEIELMKAEAIQYVLVDLFGDRLPKLSSKQRQFIGL